MADLSENKRRIVVDPHICPQSHACPAVEVCPVGALTQEGNAAPVVDPEKCILCGKCVKRCAMGAISLVS